MSIYPHGTATGYRKYACRCQACREAQRLSMKAFRADAELREPHRHDASAYANYGCRCETCTAARSAVWQASRS